MAEQTLTIIDVNHSVSSIGSLTYHTSLDIQDAKHELTSVSGVVVSSVVYWTDTEDTEFLDGDVDFEPQHRFLEIQSPINATVSTEPFLFGTGELQIQDAEHVLPSRGALSYQTSIEVQDADHLLTSSNPNISYRLVVQGAEHLQTLHPPIVVVSPCHTLTVQDAVHKQWPFSPTLTLGGGLHDNTEHIIYNAQNYVKCKHQHGLLVGTYTSPIFDTSAAAARFLVYIVGQDTGQPDIVVVGVGTTWDSQVPDPNTWDNINAATSSWTNIFTLDKGPSVSMRLYYGQTSPPTNYVDKMEILSAIVEDAIYFQVVITITDPVLEVYAYVEEFHLRLCQ